MKLRRFSRVHPLWVSIGLYLIAVVLRVLDVFAIRSGEILGEAIVHKTVGFLLVLAYLWLIGATVRDIGLHSRSVGSAVFIGAIGIVAVFVVAFGAQIAVLARAGDEPRLVLAAIDSKAGVTGGALFAAFLILGNIVNSFMEEGLFRGTILRLARTRFSVWRANLFQAALFSLWHIAWPIRDLQTGKLDLGEAVGQVALIMAGTLISGLVYGYLYLKTDSLWAPWVAHFINNSLFNLVHVATISGLDENLMVLNMTVAVGYIALIPLTAWLAGRLRMPSVEAAWRPLAITPR